MPHLSFFALSRFPHLCHAHLLSHTVQKQVKIELRDDESPRTLCLAITDGPYVSAIRTMCSHRNDKGGVGKVPRPPNPFILFRQVHHPKLKQANPEMTNTEICALTWIFLWSKLTSFAAIALGKQWHAAPEDFRKKYEDRAAHLRKVHKQNHPEYQYNPRKASDRKRRMTKAKKAQLVQIINTFAEIQEDSELTGEKGPSISPPANHQVTDSLMGVPAEHMVTGNSITANTECPIPVEDAMASAPNMNALDDASRIFSDCPPDFFEKSLATEMMPINFDTFTSTGLIDQATCKTQSSAMELEQGILPPEFWGNGHGELETTKSVPMTEAVPSLVSVPELALMEDISGWLTADLGMPMEDARWGKELDSLAGIYDGYE